MIRMLILLLILLGDNALFSMESDHAPKRSISDLIGDPNTDPSLTAILVKAHADETVARQHAIEVREREHSHRVQSISKRKIACAVATSSIVSAVITAAATITLNFYQCKKE